MNLVNIQTTAIGGQQIHTVNARELHAFLEVGKDFSNWVNDRIGQYGFVENQDFVVFAKIGENRKGGRPAKEYAVTLDMAKELAMVERNDKGKQARRYFIEAEKALREAQTQQTLLVEVRAPQPVTSWEDLPIWGYQLSQLERQLGEVAGAILAPVRRKLEQDLRRELAQALAVEDLPQLKAAQVRDAEQWLANLRQLPVLVQLPNLQQATRLPAGSLPPQAKLLQRNAK